jgi:hypothetical protein
MANIYDGREMRTTEEYQVAFKMPSNRAGDQSCGRLFLMHLAFSCGLPIFCIGSVASRLLA